MSSCEVFQAFAIRQPLRSTHQHLNFRPTSAAGFYFLHYLQTLVGGPSVFEDFFKSYIKHFSFKTVTSDAFKVVGWVEVHHWVDRLLQQIRALKCTECCQFATLNVLAAIRFQDYFMDYFKGVEAASSIDWDAWFYAPGMPPDVNSYDAGLAQAAFGLAQKWHAANLLSALGPAERAPAGASADDLAGWSSTQKVAFLDKLGELRSMQPLTPEATRKMEALYGFDASHNAEIRKAWYMLCIKAGASGGGHLGGGLAGADICILQTDDDLILWPCTHHIPQATTLCCLESSSSCRSRAA